MKQKPYDHKKIEKKWQKEWEKSGIYEASDKSKKPKFFPLVEFPFPSGKGLHTGHIRSYAAMDIIARKRRAEGFNVLYPIGWDAFGLPTENFAIKTGIQPKIVTKQNTDTFRKQLKSLGLSFDWSREVNTTDPEYYRWTQWIFLQMYKKGLAYKAKMTINWCPKDKIGLANEEVVNGACERCGTLVEKREKEQWMLGITKYADRLDKDLDTVDYLPRIKTQQRNWIGKSEGSEIEFAIKNTNHKIKVFTTRADTLFGVTYVVLAPEHVLISELNRLVSNTSEVVSYISSVKNKTDIDRTAVGKEKTGVELKGIKAVNPATNEEISIWVADYVLASYGTGAVMAVPAHDERDFEFAKKYNLPIKNVVLPYRVDATNPPQKNKKTIQRRTIHAIVRSPSTGSYLCLEWKEQPWTTFVVGGVDDNEDIVEAARREVYEETGYKDLTLVKTLGEPVWAEYFAAHKNENRVAITTAVVFELNSGTKDQISEEEHKKHTIVWKTLDEIKNKFTCAELDVWLSRLDSPESAYTEDGVLIDSGKVTGMQSVGARKEITKMVKGKIVTKFKLRDWIFSRQRYWGEPIPMITCEKCGIVPVPEKQLPVMLPAVKKYEPTDNGESPLATVSSWVNTKCPTCKGKAKRETDTMPNWAGSSWYYLRYADPKNKKALADPKKLSYWTPVDWYNGGMEHTTLHLLYSRFWHKFLFDIGIVPTKEPYMKRTSHGMILAEGGAKMSKSVGNVVNPDDSVEMYGADTLRMYEMFMGPFEQAVAWNSESLIGPRRFIEKVWNLKEKVVADKGIVVADDVEILLNQTVKKVTDDIEIMSFNTAVSSMMILVNTLEKQAGITKSTYEALLKCIAPFSPHIAEELWNQLGNKTSIHTEKWPTYNPKKLVNASVTIVVQINGKVRAEVQVERDMQQKLVEEIILKVDEVKKWIEGKEIKRIIYVPNKLVNIVIGE